MFKNKQNHSMKTPRGAVVYGGAGKDGNALYPGSITDDIKDGL